MQQLAVMRMVALKVRKEFTVTVAVPSAVTVGEVEAAAQRATVDIEKQASKHSFIVTAEASKSDGVHQKPDMGVGWDAALLNLRSWNPGQFQWSTIATDEEFEKLTGRQPPPEGKQIDLFIPSDS